VFVLVVDVVGDWLDKRMIVATVVVAVVVK
jgi:hypothetical protein